MRRRKTIAIECVPVGGFVPGVVVTGFCVGLAVLSQVYPGVNGRGAPIASADLWVTVEFSAFALLGVYVIVSYFASRVAVEDGGLAYRNLFRRGRLAFRDVVELRYFARSQWLRMTAKDGRVLRLLMAPKAMGELARAFCREVPLDAMSERTRLGLQALDAGRAARAFRSSPLLWETRRR